MADKLIALRHEQRQIAAEHQHLIADFRASVAVIKEVKA
jgi:hypothetical protein